MKKIITITLTVVAWAAIIFYIAWSTGLGRRERDAITVQRLTVTVADSADIAIIGSRMVEKWITDASLWPIGERANDLDTRAISDAVASHDFVKSVRTFVDMDGTVEVIVRQREPVMRIITDSGYNFYITGDSYIVPVTGRAPHYVPVVTGDFGLPFDKNFSGGLDAIPVSEEKKWNENYIFLGKLINFVKYIRSNDFWNSQIVQINAISNSARGASREPEIELVPRVGDHVVLLGSLEGYSEKLDRLMVFYTGALNREGWNNWNYINLKYDNQVVCSNRR